MIYETDTDLVLVYDGTYWISTSPQRNLIINGSMQVSQRYGTTGKSFGTGGGSFYYGTDRFATMDYTWSAGSNLTVKQATPSGESISFPTGFNYAYKINTGATALTLASGGQIWVRHAIEGSNIAPYYNKKLTLSFWVRSSVTGTYTVWFGNSEAVASTARSLQLEYTINAANTWEFKTLTLDMAQATAAGTWSSTNTAGLFIYWMLGANANRSGDLNKNTWGEFTAYTFKSAAGVNWTSTANATFYLTGVQMSVGSVASPFEFKDYGRDLEECQRYYWMLKGGVAYSLYATGFARTTGAADFVFHSPVEMRTRPTSVESNAQVMTIPGTGTVAITGISSGDGAALTVGGVYVTGSASSGQHYFIGNNNDSNGYIAFSAEL
jgi:hypothetical protein